MNQYISFSLTFPQLSSLLSCQAFFQMMMTALSKNTMSLLLKSPVVTSGNPVTSLLFPAHPCFITDQLTDPHLVVTRKSLSVSAVAGKQQLAVRDALNMALDEELARDERVRRVVVVVSLEADVLLLRSSSWERRWLSMTGPTR